MKNNNWICTHLGALGLLFLVALAGCSAEQELSQSQVENSFSKRNLTGSFVALNSSGKIIASHGDYKTLGTLPASTFKIYNALIALDCKTVPDENFLIKWDGKKRFLKSWNQDHTLKSAFKVSAVWYYKKIAQKIGQQKMQAALRKLDYGNQDVSAGLDKFWLEGNMKITPLEQAKLLRKLHDEKLPFKKFAMQKVKQMMLLKTCANYKLFGKTGFTDDADLNIGWFVGWVESQNGTTYFALRLCQPGKRAANFVKSRKEIALELLRIMDAIPKVAI